MATLKVPVSPDDHIQGNIHAPITLIEYGDYQCPYCGAAYEQIKQIQRHFGDQLKFVFRNFPLAEAHEFAESAAETAEFANDYEKFWDMHDMIYENQSSLSLSALVEFGKVLKLPVNDLELAIRKKSYTPKIKQDFMGGVRSGVNGTPTFFINESRYNGPYEAQAMIQAIDSVLVK